MCNINGYTLNRVNRNHHHHPQALVGPGLLKKLCPFVSVEGDFLPILDP